MEGKCKLCEQVSDLQESHIIPKFTYSYLKDTSPTGKLRETNNINLRTQDGLKLYYLCKSCENKLSTWERYFSEKIFFPLLNGKNQISYNENFLKLCVSVSWRILNYIAEHEDVSYFSDEIQIKMQNTLSEWKKFLLNKVDNPGIHEQHFYNLSGSIENSTLATSSNIHRYLQRSVAIDVINWGPKVIITYAKIPGFIIVGFINVENRNDFRNTRIHVKKGILELGKITFLKQLWDYINIKADLTKSVKQSLSKKQKERIKQDFKKLSFRNIANSGTFQALKRDVDLYGVEEIFKDDSLE